MAKIQPQGPKPSKGEDNVAVAEAEESPFRHYVPGEKPRADQAYFELLLVRVLRLGGEIPDFDNVWPRAVQALAGMNLLRLSTYRASEVRDAIGTVGGEFNSRMGDKSESIIAWAESFWRIRQIYGTFRQYIRSFEADGFEVLMEDLKVRLPGLTPEFLTGYLREAGEKVPAPERAPSSGRGQQAQRQQQQAETRGGDQQKRQQQQPQAGQAAPQEGGRGDRRRRQRGRGGKRPQQPQAQQKQPAPAAAAPVEAQAAAAKPGGEEAPKEQQQQRRRNRRRFFRRRRSGDKPAGGAPPAAS